MLPAVAFLVLWTVVPLGMVGYLSLFKTNYVMSTFVGFQNFVEIFRDRAFLQTITNSLVFCAIGIPMHILFPLWMALATFFYKERLKVALRFGYYIPALSTPLLLSTVWLFVFDYRQGVVSWLFTLVGFEPIAWFAHQVTAIFVMCSVITVTTTGASYLMFSAILQVITKEVLDAAQIDGASRRQIRYRIMVPVILPWIVFMILVNFISSFQIIEVVWRMTSGGPRGLTATMLYDIYATGFLKSAYGIASAKSLVMMVTLLSLVIIQNRAVKAENRFI